MATLTLRPNGNNAVALDRSTGTSNYVLVDEAVADDADYVWRAANGSAADYYNWSDHTTETEVINSVTLYARAWSLVAAGQVGLMISSSYGVTIATTMSAALYSNKWDTNPATSVAWTWTDIDALVAGIVCYTSYYKSTELYTGVVSQVYIEVTYGLVAGWANIKNIRAGTGSITATDLSHVWFGTTAVAVADFDTFNGVTV
jgi:hypothetical protein